jgi:hypothetical protein
LHIDDAIRPVDAVVVVLITDGGVKVEKRRWRMKYHLCIGPTKMPVGH